MYLLVINLLLGFLWVVLFLANSLADFIVGFVIGFMLLALSDRRYGQRGMRLVSFVGYVLWEVFRSNLILAWYVMQPKLKLNPGIVAIPLDVETPLEITILATVITLTPGTLSLDLGEREGRRVLYVHNLLMSSPEAMRGEIKAGFERRILEITRGDFAPLEESHV